MLSISLAEHGRGSRGNCHSVAPSRCLLTFHAGVGEVSRMWLEGRITRIKATILFPYWRGDMPSMQSVWL